MIDLLFLSLFIVSLCLRQWPTLIFISLSVLHDAFLGDSDGLMYYASAVVVDYLTLLLINRTNFIQIACLISIILNISGYILWHLCYEPLLYNYAFLMLYTGVGILMFIEDEDNNSGYFRPIGRRASDDVFLGSRPANCCNCEAEL